MEQHPEGFFGTIPTFNASVARFVTLFYVALVFLVISEGNGIVGAMLQHYYKIPPDLVEQSVIHITTTLLTIIALSGASWSMHKMVPVIPFKWLRTVINGGNLLLHVFNIFLFVLVMLVVFFDIPDSYNEPCEQGVIACGSYVETAP